MLEFLLGVATGVAGLWITTINKFRFPIFDQKLELYKKINIIASKMMLCERNPEDEKERMELNIKYNNLCIELIDFSCENSLLISDDVSNHMRKFRSFDFEVLNGKKKSSEFDKSYSQLIETMKGELNITFLSHINSLFTNPSKINTSQIITEIINKENIRNLTKKLREQLSKL